MLLAEFCRLSTQTAGQAVSRLMTLRAISAVSSALPATAFSGQERVDDVHQLLGRTLLGIARRRCGIHDVLADMAFDDLGDEPVEGTTARRGLLQHGSTSGFLLQRSFHGLELAADATHPVKQLLLIFERMSHFLLDPIPGGSICLGHASVEGVDSGMFETSQGIR